MKLFAIFALLLVNFTNCQTYDNPFRGKTLYLNPTFESRITEIIKKLQPQDPKTIENLKIARESSTAIWLNSVEDVQPNNTGVESMNGVLADASKKKDCMVVFIVNNLPRGKCAQLLEPYKTSFISNMASLASKYKSIPMAFIIEPNAVGWMTTDIGNPVCEDAATQTRVWKEAVSFAVKELKKSRPDAPIYLGLGHSRWLGDDKNSVGAANVIKSWGIVDQIRGFATNIGNYQPVGKACPKALFCTDPKAAATNECCINSCDELPIFKDNNELNFALRMEALFPGKKFVIDTGRNGVSNARTSCSNWCNIRKAGLGLRPSINTNSPLVDAFLWIKLPGETSGCTEILPNGQKCTSFNPICASVDSIGSEYGEPRMPAANQFSDYFMVSLARQADFDNEVVAFKPPTTK